MEAILNAAEGATRALAVMGEAARTKAGQIEAQREATARMHRIDRLTHECQMRARVELAYAGVKALCTLGNTPQVQELIRVQGRAIILWGSADRIANDMSKASHVALTQTDLTVTDKIWFNDDPPDPQFDPIGLSFAYANDERRPRKQLRSIATASTLDWDLAEYFLAKEGVAYNETRDVLFEVLCECADPQKLERYFIRAI